MSTVTDLPFAPRGAARCFHRGGPGRSAEAAARARRGMLWRLLVAGLGATAAIMVAATVYPADGGAGGDAGQLVRWAGLVLAVPVVAWAAGPIFGSAWRDLGARRVGMDAPVAVGIGLMFGASVYATLTGEGTVYFGPISLFVFLLLGARYLEAAVRARAAEPQERLAGYVPATAERLVAGAAGATERVAVAALAPGDLVRVAPGARVPADGRVVEGASSADEARLTGESRPVAKRAGDAVIGGSINIANPLTVRVARAGPDTVLAGIVRLMERAQAGKPRIARLADRFAQGFVAALLAVAAGTAAAWLAIDPSRALWVAAAVLIVTCPCALSVATPAALAAATGKLHRNGVLATRGHALETLARATHIVFDGTGTLTSGRLSLVGVLPLGGRSHDECLRLAGALERGCGHPIARAIAAAAPAAASPGVTALEHAPGQGVEGTIEGRRVRIGSPGYVAGIAGAPLPAEMLFIADDVTVVALGDAGGWIALFTFGAAPRPHARGVARALEARGLTVCLLSGDRRETTGHVARDLGIGRFLGGATPRSKLDFVRALQERGAVVAVVGSDVNDAPLLAQAQVSVATDGGAELAHAAADLVLLSGDLDRLLEAVDIARGTMRVIRQNLAWTAAYNALALPLAVAGLVTPLAAGAAMALSSLAVVLNALRLAARRD